MKTCKTCKQSKNTEDFYIKDYRTKDASPRYEASCKECYNKNTKKGKRNREKRVQAITEFNQYKETLFCEDCGMSFYGRPWLCDFHHKNEEDKRHQISYLVRAQSPKLKEELVKCIPLCANCHRTRHHVDKKVFRIGTNNNGHKEKVE